MVLFLTSSPCNDDVPAGVDLPCIYFERNAFVANLRRYVTKGRRFLAIAAWPDDHARNDEMAQTFAGCFAHHGMAFCETAVLDGRTAHRAAELVAASDVILLAGGHVPTENAFFHRIGLRQLLRGWQGVVMGVSAGSMNAADLVYAQPEEPGEAVDAAYQRFIPGLGLTDVNVLPHYQMVKDNVLDGMRLYEEITFADSHGHAFIVLNDGSYVLQTQEGAAVYGQSWIICDGTMEQICSDGESAAL